jgi:hypothetical protein
MSNLTPEQITWGTFYAKLHALAESIRKAQTAQPESQPQPAQPKQKEQVTR